MGAVVLAQQFEVSGFTCPRADYTDRGKTALNLPSDVGAAIKEIVEAVTKEWHHQRKAEERDARARKNRRDRLIASRKTSIKDAAWLVMRDAYMKASGGGKLPANSRQIMYSALKHAVTSTVE